MLVGGARSHARGGTCGMLQHSRSQRPNPEVGKTAIFYRVWKNEFWPTYHTTIGACYNTGPGIKLEGLAAPLTGTVYTTLVVTQSADYDDRCHQCGTQADVTGRQPC
jgi:hypothetical protein